MSKKTANPDRMARKSLILFGLLAVLFLGGCVNAKTPQIVYLSSDVKFLEFDTAMVESHFTVNNPNEIALNASAEYEIIINGQKFLEGNTPNISMKALAQSSFTIESKIEMEKIYGLLSNLIQEIEAGKESVPFQINGKLKSSIIGFSFEAPLSASGELPLPKLPGVGLESISMGSISLNDVTLKVKARITNRNDFPINVAPFPYQIIVEGKELANGTVDEPIQINAKEEKDMVINIKVNLTQLGETLLKKINSQTLKADIKSTFQSIR